MCESGARGLKLDLPIAMEQLLLTPVQDRSFAWRLGFLYAALFLVVGCYLPYLPVWLDWRSLDADEIAVLLAAPLFTRILFTPLIGFAADLVGGRRSIVIALAWGSLLSFLLLWAASGFWQMLLATILLAVNWTTIMPLIETVAVGCIRTGALDYGRVRLWGSLSFIAASLGSGVIIGSIGPGGRAAAPGRGDGAPGSRRSSAAARAWRTGPRGPFRAARPQVRRCFRAHPRAALSSVSSRREPHPGEPRRSITASARSIGARKASPTARSACCGRSA